METIEWVCIGFTALAPDHSCLNPFKDREAWILHQVCVHQRLTTLWRCGEHYHYRHDCATLFDTTEAFQQHLKASHRVMREDEIAWLTKIYRIGKSHHSISEWCGFCRRIIIIKDFKEYYQHIINHFERGKKMKDFIRWNDNRDISRGIKPKLIPFKW